MNGNSSKQVLLSVLGIAVLVVAVVGVSFAFFTYSKAGTKNNLLTTGSIFFNFTDSNAIRLTNQFPLSDSDGASITPVDGENAVMTFSVQGYDGSTKGIEYTIIATKGTAPTDVPVPGSDPVTYRNFNESTDKLKDNEVKLLLTGEHALTNNYSSATVVSTTDGALANGVTLATGKITATSSSAQQTDSYTLRMWVAAYDSASNTGVQIASGTNAADNAATHTYTMEHYAQKYYALKVNVVASTTNTTQPTLP